MRLVRRRERFDFTLARRPAMTISNAVTSKAKWMTEAQVKLSAVLCCFGLKKRCGHVSLIHSKMKIMQTLKQSRTAVVSLMTTQKAQNAMANDTLDHAKHLLIEVLHLKRQQHYFYFISKKFLIPVKDQQLKHASSMISIDKATS
ncbi:hypothetical protein T05_1982 [Trichinella murrelli]|uniref:Uncharacterized protein n=1 Tax=Trichinella murrelli TaxID=144512 RepID=A0A0V0UHP4_9BILA|nr:hypothetical protein T05_1982 [Trichinella murrelli]